MKACTSILLVEHKIPDSLDEASLLRKYGYNVVTAQSGEQAVKIVETEAIDLMLMDIDLRLRSIGKEAADHILRKHDVPIVFLSSDTDNVIVEDAENIHAYGYIDKDAGEAMWINTIEMAFKLHNSLKKEREKEKLTEAIIKTSPVAIHGIDKDSNVILWNESSEKIFGWKTEEVLGKPLPILTEDKAEEHEEFKRRTLSGENLCGHEVVRRRKDGSQFYGSLSTAALYNEDGVLRGIVAFMEDITEKKKYEEQLEEANRIINHSGIVVFSWKNEEGWPVEFVSDNIKYLLGYSAEDFISGKIKYTSHIHPDDYNRVINESKLLSSKGDFLEFKHKPYRVITKNGTIKWVSEWHYGIPDKNGNLNLYKGIVRDISDEVEARDIMQKTLETKDCLMKEINHRIKNNLLMISFLIKFKEASLSDSIDLSDLTHQIDAIRIVHEKLYQSENIIEIDIKDYIQDLLMTVFSFCHEPVEVRNNIQCGKLHTKTVIPLGLIINEIASNAIKHGFNTESGKHFTKCFSIEMKEDPKEGCYILRLSNNGKAFPEDVSFDNPGTLGLRLISALVEQLDGSIDIERKPHPVFTIWFPVEEGA